MKAVAFILTTAVVSWIAQGMIGFYHVGHFVVSTDPTGLASRLVIPSLLSPLVYLQMGKWPKIILLTVATGLGGLAVWLGFTFMWMARDHRGLSDLFWSSMTLVFIFWAAGGCAGASVAALERPIRKRAPM